VTVAYIDPKKQQMQPGMTLGAPAGTSAAPTAQPATAAPQAAPAAQGPVGTGFVNAQQYQAANAGAGAKMADTIAGKVARGASGFQADMSHYMGDFGQALATGASTDAASPGTYDPNRWQALTGKANDVSAHARLAGDQPGLTALMGEQYAAPGYTTGQKGFDAYLAGTEGGDKLSGLGGLYGNLYQSMSGATGTPSYKHSDPIGGGDVSSNPIWNNGGGSQDRGADLDPGVGVSSKNHPNGGDEYDPRRNRGTWSY
jgi:hypothetical protein